MKKLYRFTSEDFRFMARALSLAHEAKGATYPNPPVGAVVTKAGRIIATGATRRCGGAHAEVDALRKAGGDARGSTMYISLEPCCHFGRTPPCTDTIIAAGVRRVIIPCRDPNPIVSGRGIRKLRNSGIEVVAGLMAEEAKLLNEEFFWAITSHSAWITLKLALSLDGRIADSQGSSRWITSASARVFVHQLRAAHAAIAVGHTTLRADNPALTVRHVRGVSPVRFVFASSPTAGRGSRFRSSAGRTRSIIVCPGKKEGHKSKARDGVEIWYTGRSRHPANLRLFTHLAFEEGLTSVLVEGGQKLASSFIEAGLVNRLYLFYGNHILGAGIMGLSFGGMRLGTGLILKSPRLLRFGDSIALTGIPRKEK